MPAKNNRRKSKASELQHELAVALNTLGQQKRNPGSDQLDLGSADAETVPASKMKQNQAHRGLPDTEESAKGGLVQFRADPGFLAQLTEIAGRLQLPVGAMSRMWVAQRLAQELAFDTHSVQEWLDSRYAEVFATAGKLDPGPLQVLHLVPQNRELNIDPDKVRRLQSVLPPVERIQEFMGQINRLGYQTFKKFAQSDKINGYVQVFRTGQIESVRVLQVGPNSSIYGDQFDDDLIRALCQYACAMRDLDVPLPIRLFIQLKGFECVSLSSIDKFRPNDRTFGEDAFSLPEVEIKDWGVEKISCAAGLLKPTLDVFWNSVGYPRSPSYTSDGQWKGFLEDRSRSPFS